MGVTDNTVDATVCARQHKTTDDGDGWVRRSTLLEAMQKWQILISIIVNDTNPHNLKSWQILFFLCCFEYMVSRVQILHNDRTQNWLHLDFFQIILKLRMPFLKLKNRATCSSSYKSPHSTLFVVQFIVSWLHLVYQYDTIHLFCPGMYS
jgi:hypothetical protein